MPGNNERTPPSARRTRVTRSAPAPVTLDDMAEGQDVSMRTPFDHLRAEMIRARTAMNEERWRDALALLTRVVRDTRDAGIGHSEALWAQAVCHDALGDEAEALRLLEASIAEDPTALTPYETREFMLLRLLERASDEGRSLSERRRARSLFDAGGHVSSRERAQSRARRRTRARGGKARSR